MSKITTCNGNFKIEKYLKNPEHFRKVINVILYKTIGKNFVKVIKERGSFFVGNIYKKHCLERKLE